MLYKTSLKNKLCIQCIMSFRPLIRLAKMSRRVNLYHKLLTFFKNKERNRNGWQMRKRSYYNFKLQIISKVCLLNNRWITCWLNKPDHSSAKPNGPLSKHHNDAFGFFKIIIYFYNSADEKSESPYYPSYLFVRKILDSGKKIHESWT